MFRMRKTFVTSQKILSRKALLALCTVEGRFFRI